MLRARLVGLGLLAATSLIARAATADTRDIAREGAWTAFGGTSKDGTPVCGVIETGDGGRAITIKYFRGDDYLTFQIFKDSWHIRDGARFRVSMEMDDNGAWSAKADGAGHKVEFNIPFSKEEQWEEEFRQSDTLRIRFPDGDEEDWIGDLSGSDAIMDHMVRCMKVIVGGLRPTSPGPDTDTAPSSRFDAPTSPAAPDDDDNSPPPPSPPAPIQVPDRYHNI